MSKVVSGITSLWTGPKTAERAATHQTAGMSAAQAELDPYMQTGKQANTQLQNALSGGQLGGTFNPGDLTQEPGYQFRLQQGEQALGRRQAAPGGGGYFSGRALKEAQDYGQGLADQTYTDAFNRDLLRQQNLYKILSGQQGVGYDARVNYGKYAAGKGDVMAGSTIAKNNIRQQGINDIFTGLTGGFI